MKTILVKENDMVTNLLAAARVDDIVLQLPDGSEFILAEIDHFEEGVARTAQNFRLMQLLAERKRNARTVSLAQAKLLLGVED